MSALTTIEWIHLVRDLVEVVEIARHLHVVRQSDSHRTQRLRIEATVDRAHVAMRHAAETLVTVPEVSQTGVEP